MGLCVRAALVHSCEKAALSIEYANCSTVQRKATLELYCPCKRALILDYAYLK